MPALKKIASKLLYPIATLAFILVLPAVFSQPRSLASADGGSGGEVLGASTGLTAESVVPTAPSLIGPLVIQPVLNPDDAGSFALITKTGNAPLDIDAKAFLVYDLASGTELVDRNENQRLPIASLTKMMTALVAMQDPNFFLPITITAEDQLQIAPILGLKIGDHVMPIDLVKAMLVGSANDAAWTLANHLPDRDTFVARMNAEARQFGMFNTSFANPVGFDDQNNFSTATDVHILVQHALHALPYAQIWPKVNYSFSSADGFQYYIKNSNDLVAKYANIKSIKTGLTPDALQNMVSEATAGQQNKIVVILLGASDRDGETLQLVSNVFSNFKWQQ